MKTCLHVYVLKVNTGLLLLCQTSVYHHQTNNKAVGAAYMMVELGFIPLDECNRASLTAPVITGEKKLLAVRST